MGCLSQFLIMVQKIRENKPRVIFHHLSLSANMLKASYEMVMWEQVQQNTKLYLSLDDYFKVFYSSLYKHYLIIGREFSF